MKNFQISQILFVLLYLVSFTTSQPIIAQDLSNNTAYISGFGLPTALFKLREMDMHIHAGMERELPLNEWIDLSVKDGRKVMILLDHLELYRMNQDEHDQWIKEKKFTDWYPIGEKGHNALMNDFAAAEKRNDIITFRGWEIYEGELDQGLEPEPMKLAEVIGWHISPNNGGKAPDGQTLLKRTRQIIAIQEQFPIPMILFHPFSMRLENIQRTAQKSGQDVASIAPETYRFFQPGEQQELLNLLKGHSVYIEISHGLGRYWENENFRQILMEDIHPLVEGGAQFVVSTDAHGVRSFKNPFNPNYYCDDLGITPENANAIVRELLAIRAKRDLERGSGK